MIADATIDTAAQSAVFTPLQEMIVTRAEASDELIASNVQQNMKDDYPRLHNRADWGKWKGRPLAIVAGGPSLKKTLNELRDIPSIMVCGSAHDYLVGEGFFPSYSVHCDPDPISFSFVKERPNGCQYLLASSCSPSAFKALRYQSKFMWHSFGTGQFREPAIQGGCTVILRAINIAIMLGFHDLHIFGMDSCFENAESQHSYPHQFTDKTIVRAKVGDGREFLTSPAWLAQASQFQAMVENTGHMFNPIIHGDGLIAEMMKCRASREFENV